MCWVVGAVVLGVLALLVWASADIGSGVYLKTLCRATTTQRQVALTFDDGPDGAMTPRVLALLSRYGVKATFFVVGEKAEQHAALIEQLVREGHTVANHTYSHRAASTLWSVARYREELEATNRVVERLTGRRMRLFRPPFGVTNPLIGRAVRALGMTAVGWSIRSLDTTTDDPQRVVRRIERGLQPGAVVLLHDRLPYADKVLEGVLQLLERENYTAVTVDELFKTNGYDA